MKPNLETAKQIISKLHAAGYQALLAGGCVRDELMGREPKDYDVATSARPEEVQKLFPRNEAVGATFGVILVIENGAAYEVASFRSDGSYKDGRRPESVVFTSAQEDAKRRDFTVNGMFMDPLENKVLDYVGGRADLEKKVIRCIGEPQKRFEEDKLRVLRALRFATELNFEIEPATWGVVQAFAPQVTQVAFERIQIELTKLLLCPGRARGLKLLDESGLLKVLLPELQAMHGCSQPPEYHPEGDVWVHTLLLLEALKNPSAELAWAGLLHDSGKPATWSQEPGDRIRFNRHEEKGVQIAQQIAKRLRFSAAMAQRVESLVADHMRINQVKNMKVSTLKRLLRKEHFAELLELHRADCLASHGSMELYQFCRQKLEEFKAQGEHEVLKPAPLLKGEDLIQLGYQPGPLFKQILEAVETEQLEGRLKDKAGAEEFVKKQFAH